MADVVSSMPSPTAPVLQAEGVSKRFPLNWSLMRSRIVELHALSNVSFSLKAGETLCVVGESGCGKSTLAQIAAKLMSPTGGQILLDGRDVTSLARTEVRNFRKDVQIVFQDPYSSLNPKMTLGEIIGEPLRNFTNLNSTERAERCARLLERVGLKARDIDRYPSQLSGGQRQRVGIARAIAASPRVIIADEAVSALDVSVKAQILNLMIDLQEETGLSYMFITHDLGVVEQIADRVMIMYLGEVVEAGNADEVLSNPRHPYTRLLLDSVPRINLSRRRNPRPAKGEVPSAIGERIGCSFRTRCPHIQPVCATMQPKASLVGDQRIVACHYPLS